jgi:hypothetical protein
MSRDWLFIALGDTSGYALRTSKGPSVWCTDQLIRDRTLGTDSWCSDFPWRWLTVLGLFEGLYQSYFCRLAWLVSPSHAFKTLAYTGHWACFFSRTTPFPCYVCFLLSISCINELKGLLISNHPDQASIHDGC